MRGALNDALRRLIGLSLVGLGWMLELRQRVAIARHDATRLRLIAKYGLSAKTPILSYGPALEAHIAAASLRHGTRVAFASTSGTTSTPKRILYTPARLRGLKLAFIDAFARDFARHPRARHTFYLFADHSDDGSLSAIATAERGGPSRLATLQAPYRLETAPALRSLAAEYGDVALRLWVLVLSNPGVVYATNPSTLVIFLDAVTRDWARSTALVRDWSERAAHFSPAVRAAARRLVSLGAEGRSMHIARSHLALPFHEMVPGVQTYCCWTGGYVQPFLDRLDVHLDPARYRRLPMYSLSTETLQTTSCVRGTHVAFIPLAEGVVFEFLPELAEDEPEYLLAPARLEPGRRYSMVVSDDHGLRRYQTDDLFQCTGRVGSMPDLRFVRRRALSYSFTGEKLTAEQLQLAYARLREETDIAHDLFLTCVPSAGAEGIEPHYVLVAVASRVAPEFPSATGMAQRCDVMLAELNHEYGSKRASGRLGAMRGVTLTLDAFLNAVKGSASTNAQFKFLPLYPRPHLDEVYGTSQQPLATKAQ